ncbi:MAG: carbohydrate ABC transporter permease [Eubacterium sp.]|nr:carbohydrate ABC transporter permease [Eubacterium sp.]
MSSISNTGNLTAVEKRGHTLLIFRRILAYIVLIVVCIMALFPFVVAIVNTSRSSAQIMTEFSLLPGASFITNLKNVLGDSTLPIITGMLNSLIVAACSCVLSVYVSALTAYGIYAYDFRLKKVANTFIMVILMVPLQVSALGYVDLMSNWGFTNNNALPALIFQSIAAPGVFFFMRQYMESALPLEIVEAGRIDGGHEFFIFNRVVLPILKPAIAVQAIFSFVASWNNYFLPNLLTNANAKTATLPLIVAAMQKMDRLIDYGKIYMVLGMAIIPLIVVYLCLSKYIIRGIALGSVKG